MRKLLLLLLLLPVTVYAQLWNGVVSSSRATDWHGYAGVGTYGQAGTVPSASWTQCGSTIAAYGTSGTYASPTTITNAVNHTSAGYTGCGASTYVLLGSGDFYLNAGMCFKVNNNELRGSGPSLTRLHFNGTTTCQGGNSQVSIGFADNASEYPPGVGSAVPWTANYSQGSFTVTVANASLLAITTNSSIVVLDQCDAGFSGATTGSGSLTCGTGSSVDPGLYYNAGDAYVPSAHSGGTCTVSGTGITGTGFNATYGGIINLTISSVVTSVPFTFTSSTAGTIGQMVSSSGTMTNVANGSYACSFPTGNSYNDPNGGAARHHRWQAEFHTVASCSPSCSNAGSTVLTLNEPLIHPNWASGQTPEAYPIAAFTNVGVRDLMIDSTGTSANPGLDFNNISNLWIHNVVVHDTYSQGIGLYQYSHANIDSSYIYNPGQNVLGTDPNPRDPSGIDINGSYALIANNIIQYVRQGTIPNGPASGNVIAYNLTINCFESNGDQWGCIYDGHQNGTDYNLYESNIGAQFYQDQTHGGKLMETLYRNFIPGWESCANGQCSNGGSTQKNANVFAIAALSSNRYDNIVGNILGTPGLTTNAYDFTNPSQFVSNTTGYVYNFASGNSSVGVGGPLPVDPGVVLTTYRWNNWDAFNAATQTNSSEVPSGISVYPQSVPTTTCTSSIGCPASFIYASRPAWYSASVPFPAIGPDVTSGNIGQCSGTLNTVGKFSGLAGTNASQCGSGNTLNTAWGGHVNAIPAMNCYLSIGGTLDGVTSLLSSFDANTCYAASASSPIGNIVTPGTVLTIGIAIH